MVNGKLPLVHVKLQIKEKMFKYNFPALKDTKLIINKKAFEPKVN